MAVTTTTAETSPHPPMIGNGSAGECPTPGALPVGQTLQDRRTRGATSAALPLDETVDYFSAQGAIDRWKRVGLGPR